MKMKCIVLLLVIHGICGSIIELNVTEFARLPPLYELDDWTTCQEHNDKYCSVDAVLLSRSSSPILQLLEEYSSQTLKHYNRSQIHRGVCVSRCDPNGTLDWQAAAEKCVNQSVQQYGLEAELISAEWCSVAGGSRSSPSSQVLGVVMISLVVITFLATSLHILGERCGRCDGNKYLMAFSLKKNWQILNYDRRKPRQDDRIKDLACLEGIRYIGIQCVIFAHVILIYVYSYIDNPQFIEKTFDSIVWKIVLNSPIWIQAFFSLSGFLTAYTLLILSERASITVVKCLLAIINRWIRLTPVAVFALWFTIAWYPQLGNGPQWAWIVERESHDCSERWWYHVLYIHNHLKLGKFCMGHTWYLAVDMQLHVVGMFMLYILLRYPRLVNSVLTFLLVCTMVAAGCVTYFYELSPIITAQAPEDLRTFFLDSSILPLLYLPSWMNMSGYICGVATAFIHYHNQQAAVKLNQKKWFVKLSHMSLHMGSIVVFCGAFFLSDITPPRWANALYAALDRTLVAICFNLFLLGCITQCKSLFLNVLSWRGFHVLGRLSYCAYVIHFIVLRYTVASNTQLGHVTVYSMISLLITTSVVTYLICIPICLIVELPAIQLWKSMFDVHEPVQRPADLPADPPANPKFDLVANIRRNQANC